MVLALKGRPLALRRWRQRGDEDALRHVRLGRLLGGFGLVGHGVGVLVGC